MPLIWRHSLEPQHPCAACLAPPCSEKYGLAHVYKLGTARQVWVQEPREWCKDIHRKRDRNGNVIRCTICTTCHWCRCGCLEGVGAVWGCAVAMLCVTAPPPDRMQKWQLPAT